MSNILNETEQRSVYLGRLASGLLKAKIVPTLAEAYKAAKAILDEAGDNVSITKRNQITAAIRRAITEIDNEGWQDVTKELEQIAIYDTGYYAGLVGSAVSIKLSTPTDEKITSYINKAIMSLASRQKIDAGTWADFVKANTLRHVDLVDSIVKNGYANGQTVSEMVKQLRQLTGGIVKNEAEALVRTGIVHYSNQARLAMYDDNSDTLTREYPIVTFDNRTSSKCQFIGSQYAKGWEAGESPVGYPPYHFSCRTTVIRLPEGVELEGTRSAVGGVNTKEAAEEFEKRQDKTDKKVRYRGKKDSGIFKAGQIEADTQYDEWLRRQPLYFIESTLGKTKAELFKSGKLSFNQFFDMAGRPLTLAELKELDRI